MVPADETEVPVQQDDFQVLLAAEQKDLNDQMSSLESAKAEIQSKLDRSVAMGQAYDAMKIAEYKRGQDSMVLPSPNDPAAQYTQAQVNDIVAQTQADVRAEKDAEFKPQLDAMTAQVEAGQKAVADAQAAQKEAEDKFSADQANDASVRSEIEANLQKLT